MELVKKMYAYMESSDLLEELGDDAAKWARAFNQMAEKLEYSRMDEGWLIGWFANAIEHSHSLRMEKLRKKLEPIVMEDVVASAERMSRGFKKMQEAFQWT